MLDIQLKEFRIGYKSIMRGLLNRLKHIDHGNCYIMRHFIVNFVLKKERNCLNQALDLDFVK